jgi:hypothetical protein
VAALVQHIPAEVSLPLQVALFDIAIGRAEAVEVAVWAGQSALAACGGPAGAGWSGRVIAPASRVLSARRST